MPAGVLKFPSVFECSRVLNLAIDAHEMLCYQSVIRSVTEEVAGSNPVVPTIFHHILKDLRP